MKAIKYLAYMLVAALPLSLASCAEEIEYTPGEPDLDNCYGVYFPEQDNATDLELDPSAPTSLTFTAARLNTDDAITVPVEIVSPTPDIFTVSEIRFEDGQEETEFTVSFDASEVGVNYECTVEVTDPQYALVYGSNPNYVNFSFTRIKWNKLVGEDGSQTGLWRDDIISSAYSGLKILNAEAPVEVYERDDSPGYYRVEDPYSAEMLALLFLGDASAANQVAGNALGASLIVNATNPDHVYIPYQPIGAILNSTEGQLYVCSNVSEVVTNSTDLYGTLRDGIIEFPQNGLLFTWENAGGALYQVNASGLTRLILPGYRSYDYSVVLTAGLSSNGVMPINVVLGEDVSVAKYGIYEGNLSSTEVENAVLELNNDPEAQSFTESGTYGFTMEATGVYTLVTSNLDAAGTSQGSSSLSFGYVAAGEQVPVVLTSGLIVTDRNAPQGYTSMNSVEYYVYGEDISEAYMALYKTSAISSMTESAIIANLTAAESEAQLNSETIDLINGNGYDGIIGSLSSGTSYTLAVYATNGYEGKLFLSEATTAGEPDPLTSSYSFGDLLNEQYSLDALSTTWNYYAIPIEGDQRDLIGTVSISRSDIPDGEDGEQYITVEGLLGPFAEQAGIEDKVTFFYYGGLIYTLQDDSFSPIQLVDGRTVYPGLRYSATDGYVYNITSGNAMLGGAVEEGYIAFVANPGFVSQGVTFNGIYLGAYADEGRTQSVGGLVGFSDLLFVDPSIETSDAAMAAVTSKLNLTLKNMPLAPRNYVETPSGMMKSIIDDFKSDKISPCDVEINDNAEVSVNVRKVKSTVTKGVEMNYPEGYTLRANQSQAVLK